MMKGELMMTQPGLKRLIQGQLPSVNPQASIVQDMSTKTLHSSGIEYYTESVCVGGGGGGGGTADGCNQCTH